MGKMNILLIFFLYTILISTISKIKWNDSSVIHECPRDGVTGPESARHYQEPLVKPTKSTVAFQYKIEKLNHWSY